MTPGPTTSESDSPAAREPGAMLDEMGERSLFRVAWTALVLIAAIWAAFVIPSRIVLAPAEQPLSLAMDGALTALFGIDLVLRLRWRRDIGRRPGWHWLWLSVGYQHSRWLGHWGWGRLACSA